MWLGLLNKHFQKQLHTSLQTRKLIRSAYKALCFDLLQNLISIHISDESGHQSIIEYPSTLRVTTLP